MNRQISNNFNKNTEQRWMLLGHIMKLEDEWRARRALQTIEGRMCEKIPVRKQAKIITTIYREIQRAVSKDQSFDVIPLISFVSF